MPFRELFGRQNDLVRQVFPARERAPCADCGRTDYANRSATDDAADFFEDHLDLERFLHEVIAHDYPADLVEAMFELARTSLEREGPILDILGELALSFYGLGLQHAATGKVGLSGPFLRRVPAQN